MVFPTNDYAAYYRSNFKDKIGWDTQYVDDGWGWKDPKTGEKFWFVAYYNHWLWHSHISPGVRALGQAYLLTGDARYAHKAAVMLRRIAEVYPAMDHAKQSRPRHRLSRQGRQRNLGNTGHHQLRRRLRRRLRLDRRGQRPAISLPPDRPANSLLHRRQSDRRRHRRLLLRKSPRQLWDASDGSRHARPGPAVRRAGQMVR
jgi:hypothetical protein